MNTARLPGPKEGLSIIEDATCTFCGCVCDDITLTVDGGRITEAERACISGKSWFTNHGHADGPACLIGGQAASVEDGIERAARILAEAKYPIIYGLSDTTSEAQRVAVSIADWIGGCVDTTTGECGGAFEVAFQEVGEVTCTLGEIKNRGDLIIFWGTDPVESHPRHFERYSLLAKGTFLPHGRASRYCVVIDSRRTKTADAAEKFIQIKPGKDFEALWTLRALLKGVEIDADEIEAATGVPPPTWYELVGRMKQAKYGVIFWGPSRLTRSDAHLTSYAVLSLVRDMNAHARFVYQPMGGPGNVKGAENVVTWRTGYPLAVNLARGYPRFNPGEYSAADMLSRGEADAALIIAADPMSSLAQTAREHLTRIPAVVLCPNEAPAARVGDVVFRTATYGINTAGTVYRGDGVPIALRSAIGSPLPTDESVLTAIERRVRQWKVSQCS
jgi:formylmethanofuran dehydrogenase subunit B